VHNLTWGDIPLQSITNNYANIVEYPFVVPQVYDIINGTWKVLSVKRLSAGNPQSDAFNNPRATVPVYYATSQVSDYLITTNSNSLAAEGQDLLAFLNEMSDDQTTPSGGESVSMGTSKSVALVTPGKNDPSIITSN